MPTEPLLRYANYISGRQLFNDWEQEAIHFEIMQLGAEGSHGLPYGADQAATEPAALRRCPQQMHFWNAFWTILMGTYSAQGQYSRRRVPAQQLQHGQRHFRCHWRWAEHEPLRQSGVTGLAPDEALIIENRIRRKPQYVGFQVGNLWGESMNTPTRLAA